MPTVHRNIEAVIAENARWLLRQRGMSQSEFARRMNGLARTAWKEEKVVRRFLREERQLRPTDLLAVALILDTTVQALMTPDLERWATERIAVGAVHIGPLTVFSGDLSAILADPDHLKNPLAVKPPAGVEFTKDFSDRLPEWRARSYLDEWRNKVRTLLTHAYIPIPDDLDSATAEELAAYADIAQRRMIELIQKEHA